MCVPKHPQRFKIPQFVEVEYLLTVNRPDKKVMELCLAEWLHILAERKEMDFGCMARCGHYSFFVFPEAAF